MSEMYKNRKKVLIRGAGDLATGVGVALHRAGFRVIMTEIAVPLTVRREVAMSRAVYEGRIEVEGIEGILVENYQEARRVLAADKIAVIVDPEAEIRREFRPDVLVDAILAKRNTGTSRADAPYVIGLGPGFIAGKDVHAVIETMRGLTLADIIYDGQPIPNTGIPGYVGGYALERLIRASAAGRMEPKAQIGGCRPKRTTSGSDRRKTGLFSVGRCDPGDVTGRRAGKKGSEDWRCGSEKGQEIVLSDLG